MNNTTRNTLISLILLVAVSGSLGLQRCRTKCLEESIRCTAGCVLPGEAVNCLVAKYQCKENCYKDQIAMLKTKLLFKMMNIVEDDNEDEDENVDNVKDVEDDNEDVRDNENVDNVENDVGNGENNEDNFDLDVLDEEYGDDGER